MSCKLFDKLKLDETRGIQDLDAPQATLVHARVIRKKAFLERLYIDFYNELRRGLSENIDGKYIVELGSGGGFIKEVIPQAITSDVMELPNVDKQFSATDMPFEDQSVDAFLMIDVLHHINDTKRFLKEMTRCLKQGGKVCMIEPANTPWSRFIYKNFHHEPFDPSAGWGFEGQGPLTSANGAIPWIVFFRDREIFEKEFTDLSIERLCVHTPLRYLLSGGLTIRQLLPSSLYSAVKLCERLLSPFHRFTGMFLSIELKKGNDRRKHV